METSDDVGPVQNTGSALEKGVMVLEALTGQDRGLSVSEIAEATQMPKQTVHRVVRQLEQLGMILREPLGDRYVFGSRLRRLGRDVLAGPRQRLATRPVLDALVAELGETCNIGVLDGGEVLYVDRVECHWPLRVQLRPGSRVPVHCTAIGKLLLAHLGAAQRRQLLATLPLTPFTPNTLVTVPELDKALERIRHDGVSINREEDSLGLNAMAVPVRGSDGKVLAGLAVHAPTARLPLERMLECRTSLEEAAARIGRLLFDAGAPG